MRILLISYSDYNYDGRLRALVSVFERIGDLTCFINKGQPSEKCIICNSSYSRFIRSCLKYVNENDTFDILVLDNRKATIPGLLIKKRFPKCFVIQDCRELYLINETKHFAGKMGCIFEKRMAQKAQIVICANEDRAKIMQEKYNLKKKPLTYENLRVLSFGSDEERIDAENKLSKYINEDEIGIISSSGCSVKRTNDVLVRNLAKVNKKCRLFLVGDASEEDLNTIQDIIINNGLENVTILGKLCQSELKYLVSKCQIGIVNYGQYDTNNKYCASGKLYEFLYEGIPVVTTSNPPLKTLCDKESIGLADDEYYHGINSIIDNYSFYKRNVDRFCQVHSIEDNDSELIKAIEKILSTGD